MIERRRGTTQDQRINQRLLHQDFEIDDRTFEDLIGYIVAYLDHINFYNAQNVIDGSWKASAENDPIIYMVTIVKEPVTDLDIENTPENKVEALQHWYAKVAQWHHKLVALDEELLANKLGSMIADAFQGKRKELSDYINKIKKGSHQESVLNPIVNTSRELITHIQDFIGQHLKTRIFSKNDHQPQNALYITFVLLYKKLQEALNKITQRHLDFYYQDVLQQTPTQGIPTTSIVCFEVAKGTKQDTISQGTKLKTGKLFGSQQEVVFETNKAIAISPIHITSISNLYFNKNPFIQIGTQETTISSILKNTLIKNDDSSQDTTNWALFGADEDILAAPGVTSNTAASMGFMIGSPVLFLDEGIREVKIIMALEKESSQDVLWKLLEQIAEKEKSPIDAVARMVLGQTFRIAYTTSKGWEPIASYHITPDKAANTFSINFTLENDAPSVAPLVSATAPSRWPMVKVLFDELAPVYSYSFFKGVKLESITLEVAVQNIKNLSLHNNIGQVPLNKAFDLFGPVPTVGSYLAIGKSELFKKHLTHLGIHLEWDHVPKAYGGFDTYYREYAEKLTTASFQISIVALSNGYWLPAASLSSETTNLFATIPHTTPEGHKEEVLSKKRAFTIDDFEPFELRQNYNLQDPLKYDISASSGFLKLTLEAPSYAFGQEAYKKNYAETVTYNTKHKEPRPLPNPPFSPKAKSVALDYTAKAVLYFNGMAASASTTEGSIGDYFHVSPFETHQTVNNNEVYEDTLVHDFQGEGYFYIELSGVYAGGRVSLFFDLHNDNSLYSKQPNNVVFQYREQGKWVTLSGKHILSDNTHQLTRSGIVELALPQLLQPSSEGNYTLRFMAKNDAYTYPILLGIYPNSVTATCISDDSAVIGKTVAAHSITKLLSPIPGVKKVIQPVASYGGTPPTPAELFYTEVSERLRHKDRAVSFWDYERLTLQHFHEVAVAKCTNLDEYYQPQAGQVTLVVLSTRWSCTEQHYFNQYELDQIAHYIQQKANAFVQLQVRNPDIEWLVVNCVVSFYQEENGGHHIDELNIFINQFLCPVSKNKAEARIGATLMPATLATHISNLPYVKCVEELSIEHIVKKGLYDYTLEVHEGTHKIRPANPWSMLVPKPNHKIFLPSILETGTIQEITARNLQIGADYIIASNTEEEKPELTAQEPLSVQVDKIEPKRTKSDTILTFTIQ